MSFEKQILDKTEVKSKLMLINGRIALVTSYEGKAGGVDLTAYLKGDAVIDLLEAAIPGNWDSIPLEFARAKLKSL